MLLKIGELAKRTGLTVRTLHHYDELGLLLPSGRTDTGYRLYNPADVARLYRILALRQLGLSLTDIGTSLANEGSAMPDLIARQLQAIDTQIAEAAALRERLRWLQSTLARGAEPELADWLTTLEMMTVYEKYFSPGELAALRERHADPEVIASQQAWPELIAQVRQLMADDTPPDAPAAQAALERWLALVRKFTGGDPSLMIKSAQMINRESSVQAQTGIDPTMMDYVGQVRAARRLAIYARYLDEDEMAFMRRHYGKNREGWVDLVMKTRQTMQEGAPSDSAQAQALQVQWHALVGEFAGDKPDTRRKLALALDNEPALLEDSGIDGEMLAFLRAGRQAG